MMLLTASVLLEFAYNKFKEAVKFVKRISFSSAAHFSLALTQ